MTIDATRRIRIATPDAACAFELEHRLSRLHPFALGRGPRWGVEIHDAEERTGEIEAAVRGWLRDAGLAATTMQVDGVARVVRAHNDGDPLGAGYDDGRVLDHEP